MAWNPFTVAAPAGAHLPDDVVTYGPAIPREDELRLLGDLDGKRVVDLGCGAGRNAIALARAGAHTIAIDESADQLAVARQAVDGVDELRVELHEAPLAELAFLRADTIDLVLSVQALQHVDDIGRVFRQVHRVLKPERAFVIALPHPMLCVLDPGDPDPARVRHSAFDETPFPAHDPRHATRVRSIGTILTGLHRAGFRVDNMAEPAPSEARDDTWSSVMAQVPATVILRARKEGV